MLAVNNLKPYLVPDFVRDMNSSYSPEQPSGIWECGTFLLRLAGGGGLTQFVNNQLKQLITSRDHSADWRNRELFLHRSKSWSLSLVLFDAPKRFIHATPELACCIPLCLAGLRANRFSLPENLQNDVFDSALRLTPAGTVVAQQGEIFQVDSSRYAYDFEINASTPLLRLATAPLRRLEWLFSKSTLQAWQANDADICSTQLRVTAYVLGRIAHQSSVEPLKRLALHPHHAVRWAAIQNLGRLNRSEALARIRDALNDPHPHVRRAAQRTLQQIERTRTR